MNPAFRPHILELLDHLPPFKDRWMCSSDDELEAGYELQTSQHLLQEKIGMLFHIREEISRSLQMIDDAPESTMKESLKKGTLTN